MCGPDTKTMHAQVGDVMDYCAEGLSKLLTLENFAEIVLVADKLSHQGLHLTCVDFASRKEHRCVDYICRPSCAFLLSMHHVSSIICQGPSKFDCILANNT